MMNSTSGGGDGMQRQQIVQQDLQTSMMMVQRKIKGVGAAAENGEEGNLENTQNNTKDNYKIAMQLYRSKRGKGPKQGN